MKLVLRRRTDYGIRAMIHLAQRPDVLVIADQIADAEGVPRNFVPQVLQDLQRAGLVASRPGRNGGYALAKDPEAISILDIIEALGGRYETEAECALREGPCDAARLCAMHWVWSDARSALEAKLRDANLAQVARDDEKLRTN
jgi:Rrf2 family protein